MKPPRLTHWLVNQLGDHALVGDLREEFESGRSRGWYRRQVLASVAHEVACDVRINPYMTFRAMATAWIAWQVFYWRFLFVPFPDLLSLSRGWPPLAALEYLLIGWIVGQLHRTHRLATVTAATSFLFMWNAVDVGLMAGFWSTLDMDMVRAYPHPIVFWVAHAVLVLLPLWTLVGGLWPVGGTRRSESLTCRMRPHMKESRS